MLQVLSNYLVKKKSGNRIFMKYLEFHAKASYSGQAKLKKDAEEVKIPVPWGHIAGKYWGSKDKTTFLAIHGWQDNAGSFDTLIPLLSNEYSYLAIDLPGHGFSSHYERGVVYSIYDHLANIRRVQKHFSWPKLHLIGHSMGSVKSFAISTLFPDTVETYVGIDFMKPFAMDVEKTIAEAKGKIDDFLRYDRLQHEETKWYAEEEIIQMMKTAMTFESDDSCRVLMKRGVIEKNGKVTPNRDPRIKALTPFGFTQKESRQLAERIKCNVLFIKSDGYGYHEPPENFHEIFDVVKKNAKRAEFHLLGGTHHLHLERPQNVAPIINKFLADIRSTS